MDTRWAGDGKKGGFGTFEDARASHLSYSFAFFGLILSRDEMRRDAFPMTIAKCMIHAWSLYKSVPIKMTSK
jgi:hypothetical protein